MISEGRIVWLRLEASRLPLFRQVEYSLKRSLIAASFHLSWSLSHQIDGQAELVATGKGTTQIPFKGDQGLEYSSRVSLKEDGSLLEFEYSETAVPAGKLKWSRLKDSQLVFGESSSRGYPNVEAATARLSSQIGSDLNEIQREGIQILNTAVLLPALECSWADEAMEYRALFVAGSKLRVLRILRTNRDQSQVNLARTLSKSETTFPRNTETPKRAVLSGEVATWKGEVRSENWQSLDWNHVQRFELEWDFERRCVDRLRISLPVLGVIEATRKDPTAG